MGSSSGLTPEIQSHEIISYAREISPSGCRSWPLHTLPEKSLPVKSQTTCQPIFSHLLANLDHK